MSGMSFVERTAAINTAFETARRLLDVQTAEAGMQAVDVLMPTIGRTAGIREFVLLADLLSAAYVLIGELALARHWLQYVPAKPGRADIKMLADVCFEMGDLEAAASYYRAYVRQFE